MSKFFISPTTETDLVVDPDTLKQSLRDRWPGVRIEDIREGNRLFTWTFVAKEGLLEGYLNRKRQVVVLDGDVRDCAVFAKWYRDVVDSKYELAFYDDGYSHSVQVTSDSETLGIASAWL